MKQLLLILAILASATANSQNSFLYLKNGKKLIIEDHVVFYTWRDGVYYSEQNKNGKFASSQRIDIEKIEKLETVNDVTYVRFQRNDKAPFGFYKTMIDGTDKKLVFCFRPYGSQRDRLQISYSILDANSKEIQSDYFKEDDTDKQQEMFQAIKKHFPNCTEVLESIEKYKNIRPMANFFTGNPPVGFMFENVIFACK
jgi:hypothetical protein